MLFRSPQNPKTPILTNLQIKIIIRIKKMLGLSSASHFDVTTGGSASKAGLAGLGGAGGLGPNLASIIASVKSDIKSLRT